MLRLSVPQPWATLLARGVARFVVREDVTDYRGTVAIHATDLVDMDAVERITSDLEFAERLAAQGFSAASDFAALPRNALVGVAVIADLWGLRALEEVATEDDAILIGDVHEGVVFWELAEAVELDAIDEPVAAVADVEDDEAVEDDEGVEADDEIDLHSAPLEPLPEARTVAVQDAARRAGAHFDDDGLVFWPVTPTESLAALIGDDAIGDREITQRVWAYVVEQNLQDAEDHTYVYLDDALRAALDSDAEGMPTIEFTECVVAQMQRIA